MSIIELQRENQRLHMRSLRIRHVGRDPDAARWIGRQLGIEFEDTADIIALLGPNAGRRGFFLLIGGFVFTGRNACNVDMTVYGPGCMTRRTMRAASEYVFGTLGCARVTARCRRSNRVARRALEKAGFVYEGTQRHYFGPRDHDNAVVY